MDYVRKIIHIDMDAFYASVEQRDNPALRGKSVVVGGDAKGRGVVMACSYEARKFGIHSAMPAKRAYALCPTTIFVRPRFDVYREVSDQIHEIFRKYTELIQPVSLDEAYLDVTHICNDFISSKLLAEEILEEIYQKTRVTASAGVSYNKFLAKIGSGFNKPNGLTVITPEDADEFIDKLPVGKFMGIGKVTNRKMHDLGIFTGADIKNFGLDNLIKHFGIAGRYFYNCALGIDDRPVKMYGQRRSMGHQRTLRADTDDLDEIISILDTIASSLAEQLRTHELKGRTITLKVRYYNFQNVTRSITLAEAINNKEIIMKNIRKLLKEIDAGVRKVRLVGISISNFIRVNNIFKYKYKQMVFNV